VATAAAPAEHVGRGADRIERGEYRLRWSGGGGWGSVLLRFIVAASLLWLHVRFAFFTNLFWREFMLWVYDLLVLSPIPIIGIVILWNLYYGSGKFNIFWRSDHLNIYEWNKLYRGLDLGESCSHYIFEHRQSNCGCWPWG
jgi:hypothetical protein